jgi:hypothetical protein
MSRKMASREQLQRVELALAGSADAQHKGEAMGVVNLAETK